MGVGGNADPFGEFQKRGLCGGAGRAILNRDALRQESICRKILQRPVKGLRAQSCIIGEEGRKMQNISEETVRSVIGRYGDMVMRIAYQNTRDRAESEDIVQEVFLALFLRPLPKSEEHLKAWLIRVTINKSRNVIKSARRKVLPLDERIAPPSSWEHPSEAEDVFEALFALPQDERNALYLFYYEGYSAKEIGKMLRRSENAVYILLSRARKRLRIIWEEEDET